MAHPSELERLAQQRRSLVTLSDALRRQMAEDAAKLERSLNWIERGYTLVQGSRAIWPIVAALAGLLLARSGGSWLGKAGKLWSWWRLIKKTSGIWRSLRTQGVLSIFNF